jgi:two-component system response regulator
VPQVPPVPYQDGSLTPAVTHKFPRGGYFFSDGDAVLQFFAQIDEDSVECPELLLLDLNIPRADGFQVLSHLRGNERCARMRVVIMTSSSARADREKSASLNVDSYFNKPSTYAEFLKLGDVIRKLI